MDKAKRLNLDDIQLMEVLCLSCLDNDAEYYRTIPREKIRKLYFKLLDIEGRLVEHVIKYFATLPEEKQKEMVAGLVEDIKKESDESH